MMETSNLLGQSQTFCSYGVSNMNVLWLSITNQGLCVSEVQNVQAYVLEVGWGSLGKMDRDEKRAFHRDGMNWMWVGWYWKKKWDPYGVRLLCVLLWFAMICVCDLCILFVFCVCVFSLCTWDESRSWILPGQSSKVAGRRAPIWTRSLQALLHISFIHFHIVEVEKWQKDLDIDMSRCVKVRATTDKSSRDASVPTIMLQVISQHDRYLACVEEGAFLARGSEAAVGSVWN